MDLTQFIVLPIKKFNIIGKIVKCFLIISMVLVKSQFDKKGKAS